MKSLFLMLTASLALWAADATGTWSGTWTGQLSPDGSGPAYLVLKQEGSKITGTAGGAADEQHDIENGKLENGRITFDLREGEALMKVTLTQEGDRMTGVVTRQGENGIDKAQVEVKRVEGKAERQ